MKHQGKKMDQKNRSLITIFLVIILISFVSGFFRSFPTVLWNIENIQDYLFYAPIFSLIGIIINPFLVFIGFYQIGKKFDLRSNLKSLIIRLLTGAYLGYFLSFNIVYLIRGVDLYVPTLIGSSISLTFLDAFFIAFSALAIAYLRHND